MATYQKPYTQTTVHSFKRLLMSKLLITHIYTSNIVFQIALISYIKLHSHIFCHGYTVVVCYKEWLPHAGPQAGTYPLLFQY